MLPNFVYHLRQTAFSAIGLICAAVPVSAADTELNVGVVLPLTGKGATVGNAVRNGMIIAQDGLPPALRSRLKLQIEDDAGVVKNSISAAQRLMDNPETNLLVTAFSNTGNAVVVLAEKHGTPYVSMAYDRRISAGRSNTFTFWGDIDELGAAAAAQAQKDGYKKIALICTQHEGNLAMKASLQKAAAGRLQFPFDLEVESSESDFSAQVARLRLDPAGAEALAVLLHPLHLGIFAKKARAGGIKLPFIGIGNFEDSSVRRDAAGALAGQWYAAVTYSSWFIPEYRRRFPEASTFGAPFGHDLVLLLAQALDQPVTRGSLLNLLRSGKVTGGAIPQVEADGKNGFIFPVSIKTVGSDGLD